MGLFLDLFVFGVLGYLGLMDIFAFTVHGNLSPGVSAAERNWLDFDWRGIAQSEACLVIFGIVCTVHAKLQLIAHPSLCDSPCLPDLGSSLRL